MEIEVSSGASVSKIVQNDYLSIPASLVSRVNAKSMDGSRVIPFSMSVEDVLDSDIGTSAECALLLIEPEGMELIFSMQCLTVILGLRSVSPIIQENALIDLEVRAHYYNYS